MSHLAPKKDFDRSAWYGGLGSCPCHTMVLGRALRTDFDSSVGHGALGGPARWEAPRVAPLMHEALETDFHSRGRRPAAGGKAGWQ